MSRLFIDVHPDGSFTTGPYHGDPVAHAANQERGVITYMTDDLGMLDDLASCLNRHIHGGGYFVRGNYITGDWKQWGAFCIRKWGAWFERIEGSMRRARQPLKTTVIDCRVKSLLANNGELGIGTIKNRLRSLSSGQVLESLCRLQERGEIIEWRYKHPINGADTASCRLFDAATEPL